MLNSARLSFFGFQLTILTCIVEIGPKKKKKKIGFLYFSLSRDQNWIKSHNHSA